MAKHPLRIWLFNNDRTIAWCARQLEVSENTVHRWLNFHNHPGPKRARAIVALTGGALSFEDLYPDLRETA